MTTHDWLLAAFFSLCSRVRVREAAVSGFRGEDTAGVCSSSNLGMAEGGGFEGWGDSSAMTPYLS